MAHIKFQDVFVSYFVRKNKSLKFNNEQIIGSYISDSVSSQFIEIMALRNINLEIQDGMRVGLIGINGSGKSTLLKSCSRGLSAKSGTIDIKGQIRAQLSTTVGMKLTLSGRQNVELRCVYSGVNLNEISKFAEQVKDTSGLGDFFELPMTSYSSGMRTRLVMGLLSTMEGDIIVIDEWINQADASVSKIAHKMQARVLDKARCVVMSSHSEKVLRTWADNLIWLHKGEIKEFGPFDSVWKQYQNFVNNLN